MSLSKRLGKARKTINFRIATGYSLLFIGSCIVLFAMAYLFVYATLTRQDHISLETEIEHLTQQYQSGGPEAFEQAVQYTHDVQKWSPFLIRTLAADGRTRKLYIPRQWSTIDPDTLPMPAPGAPKAIHTKPFPNGETLTLITVTLPDGFRFQVGLSSEYRDRVLVHFEQMFLFAALPVTLLACGGGLWLAHRSLTPMRQLVQTLALIDAGRLEARAPRSHTGDELDELSRLFNNMLDKINNVIDGMRTALDAVAHDLRTPMTRFRNIAETALVEHPAPEVRREALMVCLEESDRILGMLTMLMDISEAEAGALPVKGRHFNLSQLLVSVADMYAFVAEEKHIQLTTAIPPDVHAIVDPDRISQMTANLLDNAVKFTPDGGRIHLSLTATTDQWVIRVADTGIGIPSSEIHMIWNRLYRSTAKTHRGIGLGLSLVRAIVDAHQGLIQVLPNPGGGTVFLVQLPAPNTPATINPSKM